MRTRSRNTGTDDVLDDARALLAREEEGGLAREPTVSAFEPERPSVVTPLAMALFEPQDFLLQPAEALASLPAGIPPQAPIATVHPWREAAAFVAAAIVTVGLLTAARSTDVHPVGAPLASSPPAMDLPEAPVTTAAVAADAPAKLTR